MKKISYCLLLFLLLLFYNPTKIYATSIVFIPRDSSPALQGYTTNPVDESQCSSRPKPTDFCSNGASVGTTTCIGETTCTDGNAWSKYHLLGCYGDAIYPDAPSDWLYGYDTIVCSTGDKYNSGNPPVMDAGKCSATAGTCDVGGPYKTCCSGGVPVGARSFQIDPYAPNEADCGGNTEVRCGGPGEPTCGIAACGGPPPTPIPTTEPTATPTPVTCSGLDYGACVSCSTCGESVNECETHIKTDCSTECVWDTARCAVSGPTPTRPQTKSNP